MKQPFPKNEKRFVLVLLLLFLAAAVVIIFNTVNSFGGGDPFAHFKIKQQLKCPETQIESLE